MTPAINAAVDSKLQTRGFQSPIIFFDGVCNLCNGFVQFIIRRDQDATFRFASLQSAVAKSMLPASENSSEDLSSIVLLMDGKCFVRSDAVLKIAGRIAGWRWVYGFRFIPRFVRDGIYRMVSRYRYRIFGKRQACMIPAPEYQDRFLS